MQAVLKALHEARAGAGMAVTKKVPAPGVTSVGPHTGRGTVPGFLGRFRELVEASEDADPTALLVALVQCKTQEHADHRGNDASSAKKRAGAYLTSVSLTRDAWWPQNLAAARAWLAGARLTAATSTDGSIVPGMEIQV